MSSGQEGAHGIVNQDNLRGLTHFRQGTTDRILSLRSPRNDFHHLPKFTGR